MVARAYDWLLIEDVTDVCACCGSPSAGLTTCSHSPTRVHVCVCVCVCACVCVHVCVRAGMCVQEIPTEMTALL